MVAARCAECGGGTIMKNGSAVIQHTDPDCPAASDFEPIANNTTGMRDILVPVNWQELLKIVEGVGATRQAGDYVRAPEVHMTFGFDSPSLGGACVIEVRGKLLAITREHRPVLRFKRNSGEVWAYKRDPETEKPELDTGIPIGAIWGVQDIYLTVDIPEIFEIQIIHQPSPHAPVTIASQVL